MTLSSETVPPSRSQIRAAQPEFGEPIIGAAGDERTCWWTVKIRALSVFEGVVYHCWATDRSSPCRPELEVDAAIRAGDVDAGPILVSVADYVAMAGGMPVAAPCLREFQAQGRIVDHLGVAHLSFPVWTPIDLSGPG